MSLFRALLSIAVMAFAAASGSGAGAQDASPAKILLAFEGGSSRAVAFLLAERARVQLGRPVIVEERPGATGRIAAMALKNAAPDGTTLAYLPIAVPVLAPLTFKDVHYDPTQDFAPVSQIATYTLALAVPFNHPARTMPEYIAWLKTHPDKAFYGTGAAGALPHFLGVMVSRATGVEMTHVAYKGFAPMSIDLVEGTISSGISGVSDFIDLHRAGRLRIIATSGDRRVPQLPDVPTFAEQGYPTVVATGWAGVFAPARTPKAVIDEWSRALVATVRSPEGQKLLLDFGVEPTGTTPEAFAAILAEDIARWAPIVKASGFRAD
ncbi:tripartite tricarboxylate transporter substrate-binding protein [Variovorax sp. GT1P44]|uniref:tripartite tricarboxylate transporter substrate-binding protein n=1 Tax=Variovorax sp. GT1P44 TaxID=3443742 RepID=UPI003F486C60